MSCRKVDVEVVVIDHDDVIDLCGSDGDDVEADDEASLRTKRPARSTSSPHTRTRNTDHCRVRITNPTKDCSVRRCRIDHLRADRCIITNDIIPLLVNIQDATVTVTPPMTDMTSTGTKNSIINTNTMTMGIAVTSSVTMMHIQQLDKFSCGYRNLQMLLSAIVPLLNPTAHLYFTKHNHQHQQQQQQHPQQQRRGDQIPSLDQIQQSFEALWAAGYDPNGARHYNYKLLHQPKWIGAVEVANYLSYYHIDATVIEFITCPESRSLLAPFCVSYFTKQCHCSHIVPTCPYYGTDETAASISGTSSSSTATTSRTIARTILQHIERGGHGLQDREVVIPACACPVVPLYLQWKGHSVSIIGVEWCTTNTTDITYNYKVSSTVVTNLLILDPKSNGENIIQTLQRHARCIQKPQHHTQPRQKETKYIPQQQFPSSIRLPMSKVLYQDCQIVLVGTTKSCTILEQEHMKLQNVHSMIAAEDAVRKVRLRQL
jgi:Peptidase family C78